MKNDARERFTLRLPTTLFTKLQTNGEELGVSTNALILQILWNWMEHKDLEKQKWSSLTSRPDRRREGSRIEGVEDVELKEEMAADGEKNC